MGERVRKGTLNIACPFTSGHLTTLDGSSLMQSIYKETTTKKLLVGAWYVRTLLDRDNTTRPERRTALIAKELVYYRMI